VEERSAHHGERYVGEIAERTRHRARPQQEGWLMRQDQRFRARAFIIEALRERSCCDQDDRGGTLNRLLQKLRQRSLGSRRNSSDLQIVAPALTEFRRRRSRWVDGQTSEISNILKNTKRSGQLRVARCATISGLSPGLWDE